PCSYKIEDDLFTISQIDAAPANSKDAGIDEANGLSNAAFIVLCFVPGASRSRGYKNGNVTVTVVRRPISLRMVAVPPWRSTVDFTSARPSPAPSEPRDGSAR